MVLPGSARHAPALGSRLVPRVGGGAERVPSPPGRRRLAVPRDRVPGGCRVASRRRAGRPTCRNHRRPRRPLAKPARITRRRGAGAEAVAPAGQPQPPDLDRLPEVGGLLCPLGSRFGSPAGSRRVPCAVGRGAVTFGSGTDLVSHPSLTMAPGSARAPLRWGAMRDAPPASRGPFLRAGSVAAGVVRPAHSRAEWPCRRGLVDPHPPPSARFPPLSTGGLTGPTATAGRLSCLPDMIEHIARSSYSPSAFPQVHASRREGAGWPSWSARPRPPDSGCRAGPHGRVRGGPVCAS